MTHNTIKLLAGILFVCLGINSSQAQTKRYVDINEASCTGPDCWAGALTSLEDALALSHSKDTIWVAQGTYLPNTAVLGRNASFNIPDSVLIYGGFTGDETSLSQRNVASNPTILSGDVNGDDGAAFANNSDNLYTVVLFHNAHSTTLLDGFTISGGNADDASAANDSKGKSGGAIYNSLTGVFADTIASPSIRNCIFSNNYAAIYGGAIYNNGSNGHANPSITACTFENNQADNAGGAIYNSGSFGGDSSPSFKKTNFINNYADVAGGAVYNDAIGNGLSSPAFDGCTFRSNSTKTYAVSYAGAVYNFGKDGGVSNPVFTNCVFARNEAFAAGASYSLGDNGDASPIFINCTFFRNRAYQNGGAIYANAGNATDGNSDPMVSNCIFWGNKAQSIFQGNNFRLNYGYISIDHSLVDTTSCAALYSGQTPASEGVVCGANMIYNQYPDFYDTLNNDFHLTTGSVAVDAGDNTAISGYTEDLDCLPRLDGTVDLGAFEGEQAPLILPVELLEFSAIYKDNKVQLYWTTLSEINNDYFDIERSSDGVHFEAIKRQAGQGNSNSLHRYADTDVNPLAGTSYYRLKQTDMDGTTSWSGIRVIDIASGSVNAYPNPTKKDLYIAFSEFKAGDIQFELYDLNGILITRGVSEISRNGITVIELHKLDKLLAGSYFVRVFNDHGINEHVRFIKSRE